MKNAGLFRAVEGYEARVLLSATTSGPDGTNAFAPPEPNYAAMLSTYSTVATTTGSLSDQTATAYMGSMPDAGFGLNDLSGSAATAGTELEPVVGPYSGQIDGAAAGFTTTAMNTWQGTQQQTSDPQFTAVASPGAGDSATTSGDSGATDPWMASFFDNDQTSTTGSTGNASEATEQQTANDDDAATETAEGDASLPEPTVSGGFTTTTTVSGASTTTTYTLTSSISLESGSMAGGDPNDNSRWDIPTDWIDTAGTIPEESDDSESDDSENDAGNANVTSDGETDAAPTDESGVRFKASATIIVSVTAGPYTAPDGSTGTTTSITFGATGSVVIMVSGSWSTGDEGNTGTVLTAEDIASMGPSAVIEMPPSAAESSMTRAPRELILGGNGTSASASGEYFWYAYATIGFSVTISNTTMDNGAAGGGPSAPSASLNLSLGSGSFSTDQSDITVQESSTSGTGSRAESVHVKEKNVSGSATSFALNLGGDDDAGDDATGEGDAGSSNAPSPSPISAAPAYTESAGNADAADSSGGTTEEQDGPLSFSSSSFNRHQKTTLYATQSSQQSASSQSSSSTNADIEDSSSGSTSLSFSIGGFDYETTSKSKSEFSYLSESQSSSDSPVGYDGRPSTHSEAASSHVIEALEESDRTFGFGLGSDGLNVTNKYSSNDTVSDVLKSESTSGSWRLVYPTITSSLAMMTNPQSTAPYWVAGPELEMTSGHNIQFNYGGNLEDGFEGSYSETTDFSQEFLNQEGSVYRYEYTLPIQETFPNTNDSGESEPSSTPPGLPPESSAGLGPSEDPPTPSALLEKPHVSIEWCVPRIYPGIGVVNGVGPVGGRMNPLSPPYPSTFDQFDRPTIWPPTNLDRNLAPWFEERYPGHLAAAKDKARRSIEQAVLNGNIAELNGSTIHTVHPNHDDSTGAVAAVLAGVYGKDFYHAPKEYGETFYGDEMQSPWEANSDLGNFSFLISGVRINEDRTFYFAKLLVMDNLGVSPGDSGGWILGPLFGAREHELTVRATWILQGPIPALP